MSWGNPLVLLMLALPALAAWLVRRLKHQSKPLWPAVQRVSIAAERLRPAVPRNVSSGFLIMGTIALAIIALARPRWGEDTQVSFSQTL